MGLHCSKPTCILYTGSPYNLWIQQILDQKHSEKQNKTPQSPKKQNLNLLNTGNYLQSIYTVLGVTGGEGSGTPLQHSCLENPMDRGAWCAAVHGVARSRT